MSKKMFSRSAGVLLNISSLPSEFGVGGFGSQAVEFAKTITKGGFFWWQTLPITALGAGDCPYCGVSANAGNYIYISAEYLLSEGLLSDDEYQSCRYFGAPYEVDYPAVYKLKRDMLGYAFKRAKVTLKDEIMQYALGKQWLCDYAVFMTIKSQNPDAWWNWGDGLDKKGSQACKIVVEQNEDTYLFYLFEQYIFSKHWTKCKSEINSEGVGIIGDMPIYVSHDSVDVWANKSEFLLDDNNMPSLVAGCPPDYFSADGQLWGNPIYDYKSQRKTGYKWWIARFERMFELYDCLRIDHFRGFDRFWAVDSKAKTAKEGEWLPADGRQIFELVKAKFADKKIIAEDLGTLDDGVSSLLEHTGFPGMRVAQFAFSDGDSVNLPHYYDCNCVAYSGTHDNDTTLGWLTALPDNIRNYLLEYIDCDKTVWREGGADCKSTLALISTLIKSSASLVIIPLQDLCGYGSDTRMNVPGVGVGNWRYRATTDAIASVKFESFARLNGLYGRVRRAIK